MRVLSFPELKSAKGIPFSRQHIHRMVKSKRFPAPLKLGVATNSWDEQEIDEWLEARKVERDRNSVAA